MIMDITITKISKFDQANFLILSFLLVHLIFVKKWYFDNQTKITLKHDKSYDRQIVFP